MSGPGTNLGGVDRRPLTGVPVLPAMEAGLPLFAMFAGFYFRWPKMCSTYMTEEGLP